MKKLFALLLAVMMVLSLAACGKDSDKSGATADSSSKSDTASSEADDGDSAESETIDTSNLKHYATLQQYLDDPDNSEGLEKLKKQSGEAIDLDIEIEDDTLVYDYTYTTAIEESNIANVSDILNQMLESSKDNFQKLAGVMQSQIDEDIKIKVVYRNTDGEVIAEKTFDF